jgi:hypothetical protein
MLAGTKQSFFSGKASQNPSAVDEAFGAFSRSMLLFSPGYGGWLLGHMVLLCSMFRPERNAAVARRIDCKKKFVGDDDKMRPSGLRVELLSGLD